MPRRLVIILGPTAVGKTEFSVRKALEYGSPIISCDSRQIYKEMSIGTAVPDKEQLARVKHYFIQTIPVTQAYTAGDYERDALSLIDTLFRPVTMNSRRCPCSSGCSTKDMRPS